MKLGRTLGILVASALALACAPRAESFDGEGNGGSGGNGPEPGCADRPLPGPIDQGQWSERFTVPGLSGRDGYGPRVHDLTVDPEGQLVAVGYFSFAGSERVPPAVRWTGSDWAPLLPGWDEIPPVLAAVAIRPDGAVALATFDQLAYVGELIVVREGEPEAIGSYQGVVRKLHWQGDRLWVAGDFLMGEYGPQHLAFWEEGEWNEAPGGAPDAAVLELVEEENGSLVVAGAFSAIGGIAAHKLAVWDGEDWTAHDVPFLGWVYAVARDADGNWVVGGSLVEDVEQPTHGGVVRQVEAGRWELMGGGFNNGWYPGVVTTMAMHDGTLYAAGCLRRDAAGEEIPSIVRWDGERWVAAADLRQPIRPWYDSFLCGDEVPWTIVETVNQRLLSLDGRLYLAGAFGGVDDLPTVGIAVLEEGEWKALGPGAGEAVMGWFTQMEAGGPDCTLYAMGTVTHLGAQPFEAAMARWKDGWEPFGPPVPEGVDCTAFAVSREEGVLVGCNALPEDDFGEPGTARIYVLTADRWTLVGELVPGVVYDMEFDAAGTLWVAGGFFGKGFLARWDGRRLEMVESGFDGPPTHLAVEPGALEPDVVVAGFFTAIGDQAVERIARFDGTRWHALGENVDMATALAWGRAGLFLATASGGVGPLAKDGDDLFPLADALPRTFVLARWTGEDWEELATPENGFPVPEEMAPPGILKLVPTRDGLVAVGDVRSEGRSVNAVYWDGLRFTPIGGGVGALSVDTAAVTGAGIFFGGLIATVDVGGEVRPSVGVALFEWR